MTSLRTAAYTLWLYGVTILLMVLYLPLLALPRAGIRAGLKLWAALLIFGLRAIGGVRLEVRGAERLPKGSFLLAVKHQSLFDIVPPFALMPDCLFVMKKELASVPLFGWLSHKAGMIVVDREGHAKAMRHIISEARIRMAEPRQLLIFPEGTRRPPGAEADYKPGVAGLYRELEVPCVPVALNSGDCLDSEGRVRRSGVVVFEILEPIAPGLKRTDFMHQLQERMEAASTALSAEGAG